MRKGETTVREKVDLKRVLHMNCSQHLQLLFLFTFIFFMFNPFSVSLLQATDVYLDISSSEVRKISLAIPYFDVSLNQPDLIAFRNDALKILTSDLNQSGLFQIIDVTANSSDINTLYRSKRQLPYSAWYLTDVQALVVGELSQSGDELTLNGNLFDVKMEVMMTGKKYTAKPALFRQMVHKFADEIVYRFTGEKGIAHSKISFVREQGKSKELYMMDYDGFSIFQLTSNGSLNLSPDWSPDGSSLYFTSYMDKSPAIYQLNISRNKLQKVTSYSGINSTPAISPSGSKLALTLSIDGNSEIYVVNIDGKKLTRLTFHNGIDTSPCWSPTGRELVFTSDRPGTPQLYIIDAEGLNLRRLTFQGTYNDSADWSPQGDTIVYAARNEGLFQIQTISLSTGTIRQLTDNSGNNENPCFSPDGNFIAFSSTREGAANLYIMDKFGYNQKRLTFQSGSCTSPDWSP